MRCWYEANLNIAFKQSQTKCLALRLNIFNAMFLNETKFSQGAKNPANRFAACGLWGVKRENPVLLKCGHNNHGCAADNGQVIIESLFALALW